MLDIDVSMSSKSNYMNRLMQAAIISLLCLFIFFLSLSSTKASDIKEVTLATGEWPPYTSEYIGSYGAFSKIVSAVFTEMGIKPIYKFYPWKRAEIEVREGHAFATFPYTMTPGRRKDYHFSDSMAFNTGRLFYNTSKYPNGISFKDIQDLNKYKIGGTLGYWYEDKFRQMGLNIEYVATDEQNIQKLHLKRVDLVPLDEMVGLLIIRKLYPDKIDSFAFVEKPLNQDSLHVMFSRTYPHAAELEERFRNAFIRIKEKGIYQKIINKYGFIVFRSETLLYLGNPQNQNHN
jgi:polar amino acid transport system substrate-binding protein